jgi:cytochrome c-type biogenesis protein CcmE
LRPGDEIRIDANTDAKDRADVDYVEITPDLHEEETAILRR